jgi:ligand-binding SRPBCC domain-containing protein
VKYEHRFLVEAPIGLVALFHSRASSMAAITPPPIFTRIHRAPAFLEEGDEMEFTLWAGPMPLRWLAKIDQVSETGFTDRQLRGPFKTWVHRHEYLVIDEKHTQVCDKIEIQMRKHPFWGLVGWGMYLGLPVLFSYRAYKTKRLLKNQIEKDRKLSERVQ